MGRRRQSITILGAEGRGGRVSESFKRTRSGRRGKSSFSVSLKMENWTVDMDSRDLNAIVGTEIYRHLKKAIAADQDPETGKAHPKWLPDRHGGLRKRTVDTAAMAGAFRRTITDSERRWGPGGKKISHERTRMKFYFADRTYASINKTDSNRKGANRIIWISVGGRVGTMISPAIAKWMDVALEGKRFAKDTRRDAWG